MLYLANIVVKFLCDYIFAYQTNKKYFCIYVYIYVFILKYFHYAFSETIRYNEKKTYNYVCKYRMYLIPKNLAHIQSFVNFT